MKFSYNWIKELVPVSVSAAQLADLITTRTAESEGVHEIGRELLDVCTARVESVEPIPASKNVKAVVETIRYGKKTVVCGAPNCRVGMITAYVPPGTKLQGTQIQVALIDGVTSEGMLASGLEIGINSDHSGILDLAIAPGSPVSPDLPDWILEIDNKSLTHRPDLWGHHGMAREVSAILEQPLRHPAHMDLVPIGPGAIDVQVEDTQLCSRYSALVFENVTVQASPPWLQYRLQSIGLNPINNIVDVTNFVMAELAQPMHAFDADKLIGSIHVRRAKSGETISALNGETYTLTPANLVIADEKEAIAVAGVIGGANSAISATTSRIVLESANFQATSVRKTSSTLKLRTDASMRFEKAQDPINTVAGLARAVELLQQISPGIRMVKGLTDVAQPRSEPLQIELALEWLDKKLGKKVPGPEVAAILSRLGFDINNVSPKMLKVKVPSWRATKDVSLREDLAEEVGRMIGYESIPPIAPLSPAVIPPTNELRIYLQKLRGVLTARGFHEVYNYSFLSEDIARKFELDRSKMLRVLNPIAANQDLMRPSLVPGAWSSIIENSKYSDEFRFFEIGREIHKGAGGSAEEISHIVVSVYKKESGGEGLFELKGLAEGIAHGAKFQTTAARGYEHPHRTADVILTGQNVGRLFEFHPSWVRGRASILDLNIDLLLQLAAGKKVYSPLQRFPSSSFDLSVLAPIRSHVGTIQESLQSFIVGLVSSVEFIREYSGSPLPVGSKSVSYRITVAASDRTLSSQEVTTIRNQTIEGMQALGYELRV